MVFKESTLQPYETYFFFIVMKPNEQEKSKNGFTVYENVNLFLLKRFKENFVFDTVINR